VADAASLARKVAAVKSKLPVASASYLALSRWILARLAQEGPITADDMNALSRSAKACTELLDDPAGFQGRLYQDMERCVDEIGGKAGMEAEAGELLKGSPAGRFRSGAGLGSGQSGGGKPACLKGRIKAVQRAIIRLL